MATDVISTPAFAGHLHSRKSQTGPVTQAIAAMRSDDRPARRSFILGTVALPLAATAFVPTSSLAAACDWAIRYRAWINRPEALDVTDEELEAEVAPHTAVMNRAINEPSAGLGDIQAKARLLMDDLIEGGLADERYDDARLTMTVLREIIALPSA